MSVKKRRDETPLLTKLKPLARIRRAVGGFLEALTSENLPKLLAAVVFVVIVGGGLVFWAEGTGNEFSRLVDAIWWGVVTITTVGYGDFYPVTAAGRILAVVMMMTGVVMTSILSGTVASIYVDRKIREGKGLQEIQAKNHIVICGWNKHSEKILESLLGLKSKGLVALVNEMDPEDFQDLRLRHPDLDIRYARGDFTNERILKRASVETARAAIVLPDISGTNTVANADERTILSMLAIKALNPEILTCAELVNQENEPHLRRANVDDIIIGGEFSGFLLANAAGSIGVPTAVREMLSAGGEKAFRQEQIPSEFFGKTFLDLSTHFLTQRNLVTVGILSQEKKISLDDILSGDSSGIDAFIKRKFAEAEIDLGEEDSQAVHVRLSPGADYVVKDTDSAYVIGGEGSGA